MKQRTIFIGISLSIIFLFISYAQQDEFPVLKGPYLGQKPPGLAPELFSPGVISSDINEHSPAAFSPDGKEVYWAVTDGRMMTIKYMKQENGRWMAPQIAPFAEGLECSSPVFSADGKKLFFSTQDRSKNWEITLWFVKKTGSGWSERQKVTSIVNTGDLGYQVSLTKNETLYFGSARAGGFGQEDVYCSRLVNGNYTAPENLGSSINSESIEASVFVAPDESYLLFTRIRMENREPDINFFVSFRKKDSTWTQAVDVSAKLDAKSSAFWIGVSPDGKYIFFVKRKGRASDMYWVSSKILDEFKPKELN